MKKSFLVIFLIVATELIGFGLIIPVLPQLAAQFETNRWLLGVLMASYSFAQFLAAPLLGSLSDKWGRKPILVASKLGTVAAYALLAYANTFTLFLIARLIDGFTGGNISVARAYITDITTPENRPKGMAIIGISFGVGFIIGPALGGLVYATPDGQWLASIVAGSLSLMAAVLTMLLLDESKKVSKSSESQPLLPVFKQIWNQSSIRLICITYCIYMIVFSGFETSFSMYTDALFGFTAKQNSQLFFYIGLLALFIQGSISRKASPKLRQFTLFGFAAVSIGFWCLSVSGSLPTLLASLAILSLGISLINSYLPSLLSLYCPDDQRGQVMGVYEGIGSLSRVIGPMLAYSVILAGPRSGYFSYGIILMMTLVFLASLLKKPSESQSLNVNSVSKSDPAPSSVAANPST